MNTKQTLTKLENLSEELRRACLNTRYYEGAIVDYYIGNGNIYFTMYTAGFGSRKSEVNDYKISIEDFEKKPIIELVNNFKNEELYTTG